MQLDHQTAAANLEQHPYYIPSVYVAESHTLVYTRVNAHSGASHSALATSTHTTYTDEPQGETADWLFYPSLIR